MTVKELIRHLQTFDEEHPIVVKTKDKKRWETGKSIEEVTFDNYYCTIITEED